MRIAIAADHRGREVQSQLFDLLKQEAYDLVHVETCQSKSCDYPDIAFPIASAVAQGQIDRAILICGTGIGMSIAANKINGVRAAMVHDEISADLSRRHNDANILCLSADMLGQRIINRIVKTWLTTEFEGGRHERRNAKIRAIEQGLALTPEENVQAATN